MTITDLVCLAFLAVIGNAIIGAAGRIGAAIAYGIAANLKK